MNERLYLEIVTVVIALYKSFRIQDEVKKNSYIHNLIKRAKHCLIEQTLFGYNVKFTCLVAIINL